MALYSELPFGPAGILPDSILKLLSSRTTYLEPADLAPLQWLHRDVHGAEVLQILHSLDQKRALTILHAEAEAEEERLRILEEKARAKAEEEERKRVEREEKEQKKAEERARKQAEREARAVERKWVQDERAERIAREKAEKEARKQTGKLRKRALDGDKENASLAVSIAPAFVVSLSFSLHHSSSRSSRSSSWPSTTSQASA
ncbi:uncharacterized protein BXZ73DRAFT_79412 [Epithele typhae]|uniref:uncharacterized protein n=1 Tax=Epithele typhae TaxID=378194 RepID=UPI00200794F8|nr:uncharacterized protein BXZ73DRAFT_79412 [Epithele typhae]KAH9923718.1 hypothetical protein BXZ73DRAFT_79412 [Epithele typhae]